MKARPLDAQRPTRVLVVDDNVDAQIISATILRHAGHEVEQAETIAQATTAASRSLPDVVLLDCRLPDGDGLELARAWRRDPAFAGVRVIVLTAFSSRQDMEAALLAGADAFLVKPVPGPVLIKQIERVLLSPRVSSTLRSPVARRTG
jgi:two-component system, OmpR family, phosphate regulon response regulator PhoB